MGTGNLTRRGRATDALPYRDAVAQRLELREPPFGRERQPVITLLDKEVSARWLLLTQRCCCLALLVLARTVAEAGCMLHPSLCCWTRRAGLRSVCSHGFTSHCC